MDLRDYLTKTWNYLADNIESLEKKYTKLGDKAKLIREISDKTGGTPDQVNVFLLLLVKDCPAYEWPGEHGEFLRSRVKVNVILALRIQLFLLKITETKIKKASLLTVTLVRLVPVKEECKRLSIEDEYVFKYISSKKSFSVPIGFEDLKQHLSKKASEYSNDEQVYTALTSLISNDEKIYIALTSLILNGYIRVSWEDYNLRKHRTWDDFNDSYGDWMNLSGADGKRIQEASGVLAKRNTPQTLKDYYTSLFTQALHFIQFLDDWIEEIKEPDLLVSIGPKAFKSHGLHLMGNLKKQDFTRFYTSVEIILENTSKFPPLFKKATELKERYNTLKQTIIV